MIRHVLLDADGVLQRHPVGWVEAAARFVGDRAAEFFQDVTVEERACLRGDAVELVEVLSIRAQLPDSAPVEWKQMLGGLETAFT